MGATDELRRLLDERGVEYNTHGERYGTWYDTPLGGRVYVAENNAGYLHVKSDAMTPEQAIAATVGERNPDGLPIGLTVSNDGNLLNWVGENYVRQNAATVGRRDTMGLWREWEQVLFANVSDEVAQDNLNECVHELLDKAATMGVGTCRNISKVTDTSGRKVRFVCSECDAWIDSEFIWNHEYSNGESPWVKDCKLNYCPNCGKKVMSGR